MARNRDVNPGFTQVLKKKREREKEREIVRGGREGGRGGGEEKDTEKRRNEEIQRKLGVKRRDEMMDDGWGVGGGSGENTQSK